MQNKSQRCSSDKALKINLIDEIYSSDDQAAILTPDEVGKRWLEPFTKQRYPDSIREFKRAVDASDRLSIEQAKRAEVNSLAARWCSKDNMEALANVLSSSSPSKPLQR